MHKHDEQILDTPGELMERFPLSEEASLAIKASVREVADILNGTDPRLLVIAGPCSMDANVLDDGTPAVVEYASQLQAFANNPYINRYLKIVMREPVSKPRTNLGQAGLAQTDPVRAYELTAQLANMEMPLAMELMSGYDVDYYSHLLTLGWVGARNVEDTTIRHLASDVDIPMLFKNATSGSMVPAEQAILTASANNLVKRMRPDGRLVNRMSEGNPSTGIIYRGGNATSPEGFAQQFVRLKGLESPLIVDCSHGNSAAFGAGKKTPEAQLACVKAVRELIGNGHIKAAGIMIESYLLAGADTTGNTPGKSLTDPCIDIGRTLDELSRLAKMQEGVIEKRAAHVGGIALR